MTASRSTLYVSTFGRGSLSRRRETSVQPSTTASAPLSRYLLARSTKDLFRILGSLPTLKAYIDL